MQKSSGHNILVTGIPRSGTTLAIHLLNQLDQVVALHEPIPPARFTGCSEPAEAVTIISGCFSEYRAAIDSGTNVQSKQSGAELPTNPVESQTDGWLRREIVTLGETRIQLRSKDDYRLIIKHNALFTALLSALDGTEVYAIVRNPLEVLISWQSVDLPVNRGRIPMGEQFDPALTKRLTNVTDVLDRQLSVLSWFFEQYRTLPEQRLVRYEDIISTNGQILQKIAGQPLSSVKPLQRQRGAGIISQETMVHLRDRLLASPEIYLGYYSAQEIDAAAMQGIQ